MNALANDQAKRMARTIFDTPSMKNNVTAGLYIGEPGLHASMVMTEDAIVANRETMRLSPPDILLTDYKMLDYLLLRPQDFGLWTQNGPETLRFVVVDELHTIDCRCAGISPEELFSDAAIGESVLPSDVSRLSPLFDIKSGKDAYIVTQARLWFDDADFASG